MASRPDYWVDIASSKGSCGAGFLLTRRYVLTAAHCLRNKADEDEPVVISRGADQAEGRVAQINRGRDVALIQVKGALSWTVLPVVTDRCAKGDRWLSPYRPPSSQSELKGLVLTSPAEFRCQGGDLVEALELEVRQLLGRYQGYSGSPVERDVEESADGRPVVGMLIEQDLHRARPAEATNVLFAVTVQHAMGAFDMLSPPAQHSRMCAAHGGAVTEGAAQPLRQAANTQPFLGIRPVISEIKSLVSDGYLPFSDAADIIRDVVREAARAAMSADDGRDPAR